MRITGNSFLVTGGASGLGKATVAQLVTAGGRVTILDLESSAGAEIAASFGAAVRFSPSDVRDPQGVAAALDVAESLGELRGVVHCAGRGGALRLVDRDGNPGSLEHYRTIVEINLIGSFIVLSQSAARMSRLEPIDGERGAVVMTASVAAFEGQIGQVPYASAKAGIVGLTLVAARDLARAGIRVCSIAPGVMDTPILDRVPPEVKASLAAAVPHPGRLGRAEEFASLALHVLENGYLNGETVRLDGALRMAPR